MKMRKKKERENVLLAQNDLHDDDHVNGHDQCQPHRERVGLIFSGFLNFVVIIYWELSFRKGWAEVRIAFDVTKRM